MSAKVVVIIACAALCALIVGAFAGAILALRSEDKTKDKLKQKYVEAISVMEKAYENPEQCGIILGEFFRKEL